MSETHVPSTRKGRAFTINPPGMTKRQRFHPTELHFNGHYFDHRFSLNWLDQLITAVPYHGSALALKRNVLARTCVCKQPKILNKRVLVKLIDDILSFGNAYIEPEYNLRGKLMTLNHSMSMWTRRGEADDEFWWLDHRLGEVSRQIDGELLHLMNYDRRQEIYGIPDYTTALHSAILNQSATLFRSEYVDNKVQLRFILHITADLEEEVMDTIEEKIKGARGLTIEDLLIHNPEGDPNGVKLIPVSGDITKDDFLNVNKVSREAVLIAHRTPAQLMGVIPENTGGFGNAGTAAHIFVQNEIIPLQEMILDQINEAFGDLIEFVDYPAFPSEIAHNPTPAGK